MYSMLTISWICRYSVCDVVVRSHSLDWFVNMEKRLMEFMKERGIEDEVISRMTNDKVS